MFERDGQKGPMTVSGVKYFTLTESGRKAEGEASKFYFTAFSDGVEAAKDAAWNAYNVQLEKERAAHRGLTLEWRSRPEIRVVQIGVAQSFVEEKEQALFACGVFSRLAFVDDNARPTIDCIDDPNITFVPH